MMKYFDDVLKLFREFPGLRIATFVICLICFYAFGYLTIQWNRRRKARLEREKNKDVQLPNTTPTLEQPQITINATQLAKDETKPIHEATIQQPHVIERPKVATRAIKPTPVQRPAESVKPVPEPLAKPILKKKPEPLLQGPVDKMDNPKPPNTPIPLSSPEEVVRPSVSSSTTKTQVVKDAKVEEITFINYQPNARFVQKLPWSYPYVKMPKAGSVVRIPHKQRRQLRGYTEANFQSAMSKVFARFSISGEDCIPTSAKSRPYEPDISLVIHDNNLNVFIDIEIDEPYAAIKRTPMHCLGYDELRDAYFTDRGWMVIRFTEKQIALQPKNCIAFIAKVIKSVSEYAIPGDLLNISDPDKESQWTALQAQKWEDIKYREQYLETEFGRVPTSETDIALTLNEQDRIAEAKVERSVVLQPESKLVYELNIRNRHVRDNRIQFIEKGHIYLIDGVHAKSVTEMIDGCFPIFDAPYWAKYKATQNGCDPEVYLKQWEEEGLADQQLGSILHDCIEKHYHNVSFDQTIDLIYFLNFYKDHSYLKPFRTEWRIFDEQNLVAGTIDMIVDNEDGSFDIYDWKRSKKVMDSFGSPIKTDRSGKTGLGLFSSINDTSFNRYCLQQSVYRLILEKNYNIRIRDMYLVIMHPSLTNYKKFKVDSFAHAAKHLISRNH